ncbi:MAG: sensor domain-containing diguanylate cyclase [Lachnospiraceae bacterium]|nr:sensor domain-containing diguanylate cyclase [Lachnospiraceae bacterium]
MITNPYLQALVQINFIPVLITVFLLFFLNVNIKFERHLAKQMIPCVILLLALIIDDNLDYYAYDAHVPQMLHRLYAMLGYDIRIFLMVCLINTAYARQIKNKLLTKVTYIPAILNALIILPCMFTDAIFYYNAQGDLVHELPGFAPHIISAMYIFFLFYLAINSMRLDRKTEAGILFLCAIMTVLAVLVEMFFSLRGILIGVIALDITFYYLYLHIEHFRFDNLTKIFNRDSFYADIRQYGEEKITHVLSIDVNDLKKTNDTMGHDAGDKLIKDVADILRNELDPSCYLYRVGGDEFVVLCLLRSNDEVKNMVSRMYKKIEEAHYSLAIGWDAVTSDVSVTEAYKQADRQMYETKMKMKASRREETAQP